VKPCLPVGRPSYGGQGRIPRNAKDRLLIISNNQQQVGGEGQRPSPPTNLSKTKFK